MGSPKVTASVGGGAAPSRDGEEALSQKHIRGSSLLLAGRLTSMLVKFVAQVLIVRYLSTGDYGAWTYALAAVLFFRGFATLGLNKTLPRFLAIYLEREDYPRFFGTLAAILVTLLLATGSVVVAFYLFPAELAALAGEGPDALHILFVVILLVPLEALDDFLTGLCATFSKSRVIFVRRYIISPALLLGVALSLVLFGADVLFLAYGYVIAIFLGVLYYAWTAAWIIIGEGLPGKLYQGVVVPGRELVTYTAPLMTDWVGTLVVSIGPLMLGYYADMDAVALFRVVMPLVAVAEVVKTTFALLFKPTASRLFAREDREGLDALYWRTATWVAVLGFPAFAVLFTLSEPLVVLFFGERYQASAPILSLLVVGYYLGSALGPNTFMIKVVGKMRWLVGINLFTGLATLVLHRVFVPPFGPLGAGAATALSILLFYTLNHVALRAAAGVRVFDPQYARPFLVIAASVLLLVAVRSLTADQLVVMGLAVGGTIVAVLVSARQSLRFSETFPEFGRFRLVRAVLG